LNQIKKARNTLLILENNYTYSPVTDYAELLLKWVDILEEMNKSVDISLSTFEQGKAYYQMIDFKKAVSAFNNYIDFDKKNTLPALYFRGRSFEGLGNYPDAQKDYLRIINLSVNSNWAKLANRRLYIINKHFLKNTAFEKYGRGKKSS